MTSSTDRRGTVLSPELLRSWEFQLAPDDESYAAAYPGPPPPGCVHTVYLPVPRFGVRSVDEWRSAAQESTRAHPDQWATVLAGLAAQAELGSEGAARLAELTAAKLAREPIEDLRIDFEDGFRAHRGTVADDEEEDGYAVGAAAVVADAALPRCWGLRIRSLGGATRARGLRTLDLFLAEVLRHGPLPPGFVITLPKVTSLAQITVFCAVLTELEQAHGMPAGSLRFEIQVETPQTVLGADGTVPVARMIHAAGGRVSGLHFGTYDYTASLGILAAHQNLRHPVADFAKSLMLLAAAETGVRVSDGSDNKVPVGDPVTVGERWAAHADGVTRALRQGIFQGWDLHPAQLPTRFAATFAFFRAGWQQAAVRLADYHRQDAGATGVLDEPATAFALARHLAAALACGAVTPAELRDAASIDESVVTRYLVRGAPPGPVPPEAVS
jgi:citrate lyase beta subunit